MKIQRRDGIREYLLSKGEASLGQLMEIYPDVSAMTIRRDLARLEYEGAVIRTRGGAKAAARLNGIKEDIYSARANLNVEAKMKIARKALKYFETGRSIFIDSGTTTMCLAKMLPDENYSIITSAPNICLEILKNIKPAVTIIGGRVSRDNISASGENTLKFIKNINIDIAFMATSAFSLKSGFTSGDFNECELKKAVIGKAGKVIMLMDSDKIDKNMPYTFSHLKNVDILVCEKELPEAVAGTALKYGVALP